ncbi:MAG TPA: adenylyltransferase/cytidyltransferase family protein [Candidatus Saccharimonadales bacterium]|nr:adenylyltransferase/cytidyltransferase family protein [Candidatus Saccharimonadales bacterium]
MARIGIFAGTFDPVHNGHVAFALAAMNDCHLDSVVFLPEREPRGKHGVTPIGHRVAMLECVVADRPDFSLLQLAEPQFDVRATLPQLQRRFAGDELFLLVGSDVAAHIVRWDGAKELLAAMEVVIGQRAGDPLPQLPVSTIVLPTVQAHVAASDIRSGLSQDIAPDVRKYIDAHHLYGMATP